MRTCISSIYYYHEKISDLRDSGKVDFISLIHSGEIEKIELLIKKIKEDFISTRFYWKAARLLKGETLNEEELSRYKQHNLIKRYIDV